MLRKALDIEVEVTPFGFHYPDVQAMKGPSQSDAVNNIRRRILDAGVGQDDLESVAVEYNAILREVKQLYSFDLVHCAMDTFLVMCLPLARVFDRSAVWWAVYSTDGPIPVSWKTGVCSEMSWQLGQPHVALTADSSLSAVIMRADFGLRLPVLRQVFLHITGRYSAAMSANVVVLRYNGWASAPPGALFTRVLQMYGKRQQAIGNPIQLSFMEGAFGVDTGVWVDNLDKFASTFRAAIYIPGELTKLLPREMYAMGLPLFFVSQHFLVQISMTHQYHLFDHRNEVGTHCGMRNRTAFPLMPFIDYRMLSWRKILSSYFFTSMLDLYHMPGVQVFESFTGLFSQLANFDAAAVSTLQLDFMARIREEETAQARRMAHSILSALP